MNDAPERVWIQTPRAGADYGHWFISQHVLRDAVMKRDKGVEYRRADLVVSKDMLRELVELLRGSVKSYDWACTCDYCKRHREQTAAAIERAEEALG